jgi:two-component system, OmpR family, sensor histidine kinase BaeS
MQQSLWISGKSVSSKCVVVPHLFESFYRGEKSRNRGTGGAGLGLAIARGIVRAHSGDIRVESQVPKGTRFIFHIP